MPIRYVILILFYSLSLVFPARQTSVPVAEEGHHHLKLENPYVRIFDVVVDPSDATLYHLHANDYAFVSIGSATLIAQALGGQPSDLILKDGEARFSKGPLTHRVTNIGTVPFHNLTVEILGAADPHAQLPPLSNNPSSSLVLENDKIRVTRLVLEPGQSAGMHPHPAHSLAIVVSGARLTVQTPSGQPQTVEPKAGDFQWRDAAVQHALKNIGTTRFEAVEIEHK